MELAYIIVVFHKDLTETEKSIGNTLTGFKLAIFIYASIFSHDLDFNWRPLSFVCVGV